MDVREAGRQGGIASRNKLTAEQRSDQARVAVKARWEKFYKANPDKRPKKKKKA